jgi:S1-C subfamily serine protease
MNTRGRTARRLSNPIDGAQGQQVLFLRARFEASQLVRKAVGIGNWDAFDGVMLSIHFSGDGGHDVYGSGVLIAPGFILTATHIFTEQQLNLLFERKLEVVAFGIGLNHTHLWEASFVAFAVQTDLCILCVKYATDLPDPLIIRTAHLADRLPDLGEHLTMVGFRAASASVNDGAKRTLGEVKVAAGIVRAQYPDGRDRVMINFPAVEVDFAAEGGMSGGPVFDSNGYLVGILASSMDDPPAVVSLLKPALDIPLPGGGWPEQLLQPGQCLRDLDTDDFHLLL